MTAEVVFFRSEVAWRLIVFWSGVRVIFPGAFQVLQAEYCVAESLSANRASTRGEKTAQVCGEIEFSKVGLFSPSRTTRHEVVEVLKSGGCDSRQQREGCAML